MLRQILHKSRIQSFCGKHEFILLMSCYKTNLSVVWKGKLKAAIIKAFSDERDAAGIL